MGRGRLLVAMVVVSLNLRPLIAAVPPLITTVANDLGVPSAAVGVTTTIALLCMAFFAPVAVSLQRRWSPEHVISLALTLCLLGSALRLVGGTLAMLWLSTLVGGVGIAVLGATLPGLVRRAYADRAGLVTGLYTVGLTAGATAASALSVPLLEATGSWERSLAAWAVLAVLGLAVWLPATRRVDRGGTGGAVGMPWRQGRAWLLVAWLTGSAVLFYAMLTWLAPYYEDLGWSEEKAGYLLGTYSLWQILSSLLLPTLADRRRDRRVWLVLSAVLFLAGLVLTTLAPLAAPWVWTFLSAFGIGGVFSLGLTLLVDFADTPAGSSGLSAMAFLVAYSLAAAATPVVGLVRDRTGSLHTAFVALIVVAVLMVPLACRLRPPPRTHAPAAPDPPSAATTRTAPPTPHTPGRGTTPRR